MPRSENSPLPENDFAGPPDQHIMEAVSASDNNDNTTTLQQHDVVTNFVYLPTGPPRDPEDNVEWPRVYLSNDNAEQDSPGSTEEGHTPAAASTSTPTDNSLKGRVTRLCGRAATFLKEQVKFFAVCLFVLLPLAVLASLIILLFHFVERK